MEQAKRPALTPPEEKPRAKKAKTLAEMIALSKASGLVAAGTPEDQMDVINKARVMKEIAHPESIEEAKPVVLTKLEEELLHQRACYMGARKRNRRR